MPKVRISDKGQITLPAAVRKRMGWTPGRELLVEVGEDEITLRALKTLSQLDGIFHKYVQGRKRGSWEAERRAMEQAVAEQVADE